MTRARRRRRKTKCCRGRGAWCPARPGPQNSCGLPERGVPMRPRHSSLPLNHSLLPNEDSIAQFEEQSHNGGEEGRHDDEGCEDFAVFGPALRPTDIPTEAGFNSHSFRDHESQKRRTESHEQADENIRNRRWNRHTKNKIGASGAERPSHVISSNSARTIIKLRKTAAGPGKYGSGSKWKPNVIASQTPSNRIAAVKIGHMCRIHWRNPAQNVWAIARTIETPRISQNSSI